jgi:hypothetical protein
VRNASVQPGRETFLCTLPQNVNYAVKGGLVYDFLSGVPELSGKPKAARTGRDGEAASGAAEHAAVLVVAE